MKRDDAVVDSPTLAGLTLRTSRQMSTEQAAFIRNEFYGGLADLNVTLRLLELNDWIGISQSRLETAGLKFLMRTGRVLSAGCSLSVFFHRAKFPAQASSLMRQSPFRSQRHPKPRPRHRPSTVSRQSIENNGRNVSRSLVPSGATKFRIFTTRGQRV